MVARRIAPILLLIWLTEADEYAYTVIVPAGKTECYSHAILDKKYRSFEIDYQVIAGGELDITFYITSPSGLRLINDLKHSDGTHSIQSEKRVFFELFLLDAAGQFLGGFDARINVAAEVLRTLDTHIDVFQRQR
ncbi:unnamed protein product [Gongylonema pulchrum]|uniref:GOLD domain-containing protein n=1 Tax=Gongylonema pulchrum TaxID=637853 RepID=A0A183EJN6_9BILA|nr:unnamed protein product [Gongylonema pulchrum]